jgi:hypothetical protein
MQGRHFHPGLPLSRPVRDCIPHVIDAVLRELRALGIWYAPKPKPARGSIGRDRQSPRNDVVVVCESVCRRL